MDANDWFANQVGNPRAAEHHNDFGGVFGGPVWKKQDVFLLLLRRSTPRSAADGSDRCSFRLFTSERASLSLAPVLAAYPIPNDTTATPGVFTNPFTGTYSNRATLNATSIRIDHALTSRFLIFGRYNDAPSHILQRTDNLSDVNTLETEHADGSRSDLT